MKKAILAVLVLAAAGLVYLYERPLPKLEAVSAIIPAQQAGPVALPWPGRGQAAIGAVGYGVLASHGAQQPVPIASVTKVITAYAVLSQRPLAAGQQGPIITLDSTDLGYFNYYYTHNGSDTNVAVGEKISEYQALQAMLLPSSNNMADSLARWAFGSLDSYVSYANRLVKNLGLSHTTIGSANGFSDKSYSTAEDLVKLGEIVLKSPVITGIASQKTASIPVEGAIGNINGLLGSYGIDGIKTGNTDEAGGCYLFSSHQTVAGHQVELVGAVLGQPALADALQSAPPVINAAKNGFTEVAAVKRGQTMGYYQAPWGTKTSFIALEDASLLAWRGNPPKIINSPQAITAPAQAGAQVGTVTVKNGDMTAGSPLVLNNDLPAPSFWWRITHW